MPPRRTLRSLAAAVALAAAAGVIPASTVGVPTVSAANGPGAGGEYHTVPESRIFDSRPTSPINDPSPGAKVDGQEVHIQILGKAGVPVDPADVLAVAINVTVADATAGGYAEVYPKGFRPSVPTSLVNFQPGPAVPNMVIVGVGNDGSITVRPSTPGVANGSVQVLVDVFGWVSKTGYVDAADSGARLVALPAPERLMDQRPDGVAVGAGQTVSLQVRGNRSIPNNPNVTGVVINLTVDNGQPIFGHEDTFVSALSSPPAPGVPPRTSTTNVRNGLVKANLAFVPIGADGKIHFYNSTGNAQVIVDAFGYLEKGRDEATYAGRIIPLEEPFRAFDTRQPLFGEVPLGFGEQEDWSFWCFADSITVDGQAVNQQVALLGNVTGTAFNRIEPHLPNDTFLTLRPTDPDAPIPPRTSNVNVYPNIDVPNMAMLTYGDSEPDGNNVVDPYMVRAYNHNGKLHYILDVFAIVLSDDPAPAIPDDRCDTA